MKFNIPIIANVNEGLVLTKDWTFELRYDHKALATEITKNINGKIELPTSKYSTKSKLNITICKDSIVRIETFGPQQTSETLPEVNLCLGKGAILKFAKKTFKTKKEIKFKKTTTSLNEIEFDIQEIKPEIKLIEVKIGGINDYGCVKNVELIKSVLSKTCPNIKCLNYKFHMRDSKFCPECGSEIKEMPIPCRKKYHVYVASKQKFVVGISNYDLEKNKDENFTVYSGLLLDKHLNKPKHIYRIFASFTIGEKQKKLYI